MLAKIIAKGKEQQNKKGCIKYLLNQCLDLKPGDLLEIFEGHGIPHARCWMAKKLNSL